MCPGESRDVLPKTISSFRCEYKPRPDEKHPQLVEFYLILTCCISETYTGIRFFMRVSGSPRAWSPHPGSSPNFDRFYRPKATALVSLELMF